MCKIFASKILIGRGKVCRVLLFKNLFSPQLLSSILFPFNRVESSLNCFHFSFLFSRILLFPEFVYLVIDIYKFIIYNIYINISIYVHLNHIYFLDFFPSFLFMTNLLFLLPHRLYTTLFFLNCIVVIIQ